MRKILSCGICVFLVLIFSVPVFADVSLTYNQFIIKKNDLVQWSVENGHSTSTNLEDYRMIVFDNPSTIIKGVSYLLIKPQTSWSGYATPYIGGSYGYLCISPSWSVEFYNNSYYFDSSNNWKTLKNPVYSDINILNQSGSVIHQADFGLGSLEPPSSDETTEYPSDFIGPLPPSDYYNPILSAGEEEESLTVQHEWLSEAVSNVESWQEDLDEYITGIDEAASNVADYLDSGSSVLSSFLSAAPTAVVAFVTFGLAFLVIRKVIGR